jgi:hypothetical protein
VVETRRRRGGVVTILLFKYVPSKVAARPLKSSSDIRRTPVLLIIFFLLLGVLLRREGSPRFRDYSSPKSSYCDIARPRPKDLEATLAPGRPLFKRIELPRALGKSRASENPHIESPRGG